MFFVGALCHQLIYLCQAIIVLGYECHVIGWLFGAVCCISHNGNLNPKQRLEACYLAGMLKIHMTPSPRITNANSLSADSLNDLVDWPIGFTETVFSSGSYVQHLSPV